jgi:hypothetical protein
MNFDVFVPPVYPSLVTHFTVDCDCFVTVKLFSKDGVTGEWRKLHNDELNDLYSSPNIVRVIKSRMRWAWHLARIWRREVCIGFWWGNLREGHHWGDPDVDGRIILGRIFRKWGAGLGTGLGWLRIETDGEQL